MSAFTGLETISHLKVSVKVMESETFNIFIIGLTKENILFILDYMNYLVVYDTTAAFFALNKYFISRIHS